MVGELRELLDASAHDPHRERLLYAARVLRAVADLGRDKLGDLYPEAVAAGGAIKIALGVKDEDCEALGLAPGQGAERLLTRDELDLLHQWFACLQAYGGAMLADQRLLKKIRLLQKDLK